MPRFSTRPVKEAKEKGVTKADVEKYEEYVERIDASSVGVLRFRETEDINHAREALRAVAEKRGTDLIIRRPRGVENVLEFRLKNT